MGKRRRRRGVETRNDTQRARNAHTFTYSQVHAGIRKKRALKHRANTMHSVPKTALREEPLVVPNFCLMHLAFAAQCLLHTEHQPPSASALQPAGTWTPKQHRKHLPRHRLDCVCYWIASVRFYVLHNFVLNLGCTIFRFFHLQNFHLHAPSRSIVLFDHGMVKDGHEFT